MRVVNVIEVVENNVQGIESFGVFEEQLADDVATAAEELLIKKAKENGMADDDEEAVIEDGYYENGTYLVTIVWSYIGE